MSKEEKVKFKKGHKVTYTTPKGRQTGEGKVVDVVEGARGAWYTVKDSATGALVKLRAANLAAATAAA